eukprot:gene6562-8351_t
MISRPILALAAASFGIGTTEFVIMGLLPDVARDFAVSIPQAGHVISAYALGVVVGAPVLAVLCAHWGRRALLMALMVVYALGNFASALAPGYGSLSAMRLFTGLPHGTYFGVAALVAGMIWGSKLGVQFSLTTLALRALPVVILGGLTSVPGAIIGGLIIGVGEKLSEVYLGPYVGGGIEIWFAYVLALVFLLFRPQGLFGEKIIDRV